MLWQSNGVLYMVKRKYPSRAAAFAAQRKARHEKIKQATSTGASADELRVAGYLSDYSTERMPEWGIDFDPRNTSSIQAELNEYGELRLDNLHGTEVNWSTYDAIEDYN